MNENMPNISEPNSAKTLVELSTMEDRLKTLRVEQERLTSAVQQYPESGFNEDLDKVSNEIAELDGEIRAYHEAREGQQSMDI